MPIGERVRARNHARDVSLALAQADRNQHTQRASGAGNGDRRREPDRLSICSSRWAASTLVARITRRSLPAARDSHRAGSSMRWSRPSSFDRAKRRLCVARESADETRASDFTFAIAATSPSLAIGPGKVALLEAIEETGSITSSGQEARHVVSPRMAPGRRNESVPRPAGGRDRHRAVSAAEARR